MLIDTILFIFGFIVLIKGADILVDGASSIAKKFGVSTFFIGLTIVAFGTSAPELVVSSIASFKGSADIALGNVIGSNISNTLLILGACAVISPLLVKKATINKEIPFSLLAILAASVMVNDVIIDHHMPNGLTRIDGIVLVLFFTIFLYYTFGISREKEGIISKAVSDMHDEKEKLKTPIAIGMIIGGLVGLAVGGKFIIDGAISIAQFFHISEAFIALSIVALGTSLPELAASGVAAYKGKTDIAVGNVVGSNIFNLLWVLGVSSIIRPIPFSLSLNFDFMILIIITILLLFLVYFGKKNILGRGEGGILLAIYVFYIVYLVIRG